MQTDPFDFTRAPFRLREGAEPQDVACEMVASFAAVSEIGERTTRTFRAVMTVAGIDGGEPLRRAGEAIARDIDAGIGDGRGNAYHNSQHFCEVVLSALYLSLLAGLPRKEQAQLLVAALAHDFHHDGGMEQGTSFRLERESVDAAAPYLASAGVAEDERNRLAVLIFATQVTNGVPFARECHRYFAGSGSKPAVPAVEPRLAPLASDARLALQAVLLAEADVLPSVGLTVAHGELVQENLAREWGRPLTATDKLHFLEKVFGSFTVSRFFAPNLERMKRRMREVSAAN